MKTRSQPISQSRVITRDLCGQKDELECQDHHVYCDVIDGVQGEYLLTMSPSDSADYGHTDHSDTTTELWELPVFLPADGIIILHIMIKYHYFLRNY